MNERVNGVAVNTKIEQALAHGNLGYKLYDSDGFTFYAGAGISYLDVSIKATTGASSFSMKGNETGWNIMAGVRKNFGNNIELDANVRHIDLGESELALSVSARYYATQNVSFQVGYTNLDSSNKHFILGAAYHF